MRLRWSPATSTSSNLFSILEPTALQILAGCQKQTFSTVSAQSRNSTHDTAQVPPRGAMHAVGARICFHSRKKQHRELSPGADRCRIDRPPGVEKLQQLLARAIVVPGPVAFDDFNELGGRLLAPVLGIEEDGKIEPGLKVAGIRRDFSYKLGSFADGGGLPGEVERRSGGNDRVVPLAARGNRGQYGPGAFGLAGGNEELRQPGHVRR